MGGVGGWRPEVAKTPDVNVPGTFFPMCSEEPSFLAHGIASTVV